MSTNRQERITSYLDDLAGGASLDLESYTGELESSVREGVGEADAEIAAAALRRVRERAPLSPEQQLALEAVVLPKERPVVLIQNNAWEPIGGRFKDMDAPDVRERLKSTLRAVGRVDLPGGSPEHIGTAFVIGPGLLLTNAHVAEALTGGASPTFVFDPAGLVPRVDFKREFRDPAREERTITRVEWVHPHWDAAILRFDGETGDIVTFQVDDPAQLPQRRIAVVGYPARDWRGDVVVQDRVFASIYGVKRFQPGLLRGLQPTVDPPVVEALGHDASTLGGNSGSPLFDVLTGNVVGLHFSGRYLRGNWAVPAAGLVADPHFRDLGVKVSGAIPEPPSWLSKWSLDRETTTPGESTAALPPTFWADLTADELRARLQEAPRQVTAAIEASYGPHASGVLDALRPADGSLGDRESTAEGGKAGGDIVYLHGILGSHLSDFAVGGKRVWLDPLRALFTDLGNRLALQEDGRVDRVAGRLDASGHLQLSYGNARERWRRGYNVYPFAYDWRKSIRSAARRLDVWLEETLPPDTTFHIVAHSMGGLVAAAWAKLFPDRMEKLLGRAVFVGSPLNGALAPVECLLGTYPFLRRLAMVSASSKESLRSMAASFPGLLDMLPDPTVYGFGEELYQASSWDPDFAPPQAHLDAAREFKDFVRDSPIFPKTTLLVGTTYATVGTLRAGFALEAGERNRRGDGTVPLKGSLRRDVAALYHAPGKSHADMMNDDAVIRAIPAILEEKDSVGLDLLDPDNLPAPVPGGPSLEAAGASDEQRAGAIRTRLDAGELRAQDVLWLLEAPAVPVGAEPPDQPACDAGEGELEVLVVRDERELSGPQWCGRYPDATSLDALRPDFAARVQVLVDTLTAAGVAVTVGTTWRPPQRAWLMHLAWLIAEGASPGEVDDAGSPGIPIRWSHETPEASTAAARAMVDGFHLQFQPALQTDHTRGEGVDLRLSWSGEVVVDVAGRSIPLAAGEPEAALAEIGTLLEVFKVPGTDHWRASAK